MRHPGADLAGVYYLRSLPDSQTLQKAIREPGRVVVIGAGWIGCEVAASARQMGAEVAMVDLTELPVERALGVELGRFFGDVHADEGVKLHLGVGVQAFRGGTRVEQVVLANGEVLPADAVVVGVGVLPRVELAGAAGLDVDNGVVTDEHLATSVPGIFAVGDVANAWHPLLGHRLRLEHWSSALNQGPAAARNMLGRKTVWPGRVGAGMHVNTWGVRDTLAALVAAKRPLDPAALAVTTTDVDLTSLVPAA